MAGAATAERFDQLATTTNSVYAKTSLQDQIFNADPLMKLLYTKGKKEQYLKGGRFIEVPLMTGRNNNGGSYSGLDVLSTETAEGIANALFPWKMYSIPTVISNEDLLKNMGDAAIIDLLKSKIKQTELSARDDLATMLYGDGTGNGSKDLYGLQALVSATSTLAGIDPATETAWASVADSSAVAVAAGWMGTMVNNVRGSGAGTDVLGASVGNVDVIVTTQTLFEAYEALLEPTLRNQDTKIGDLGFSGLKFKGAEITWSDKVPAGYMYFLSTAYLGLKVHPDRDFAVTPFQTPINQDGRISHLQLMGNFVTSNRRRLGVATAKTA